MSQSGSNPSKWVVWNTYEVMKGLNGFPTTREPVFQLHQTVYLSEQKSSSHTAAAGLNNASASANHNAGAAAAIVPSAPKLQVQNTPHPNVALPPSSNIFKVNYPTGFLDGGNTYQTDYAHLVKAYAIKIEGCLQNNSKIYQNPNFKKRTTMFDSEKDPKIPIRQYLANFRELTPEAFIFGMILAERFYEKCGNKFNVFMDPFNVHRVLAVSLTLGSKYINDRPFSNKYQAKIAGINSAAELNALEIEFLGILEHEVPMIESARLIEKAKQNILSSICLPKAIAELSRRTPTPPSVSDSPPTTAASPSQQHQTK